MVLPCPSPGQSLGLGNYCTFTSKCAEMDPAQWCWIRQNQTQLCHPFPNGAVLPQPQLNDQTSRWMRSLFWGFFGGWFPTSSPPAIKTAHFLAGSLLIWSLLLITGLPLVQPSFPSLLTHSFHYEYLESLNLHGCLSASPFQFQVLDVSYAALALWLLVSLLCLAPCKSRHSGAEAHIVNTAHSSMVWAEIGREMAFWITVTHKSENSTWFWWPTKRNTEQ